MKGKNYNNNNKSLISNQSQLHESFLVILLYHELTLM
uniref:Uncharacterized protein n=1 Tax=Rhizophora mucronata TaxID=61149 RepID=A0A2P2QF05_RHIMU